MRNQWAIIAISLLLGFMLMQSFAHAGDKDTLPSAPDSVAAGAQQVNVDAIKEKYWARGDENELGVVQNRLYTKSKKFELGLFGGIVATDPFLSVQNIGATLGYHFSEYFSFHVLAFKDYSSTSGAFQTYQNNIAAIGGVPASANSNDPHWYLGGEAMASILYGKLSLVGKAIIYYDMHFLAGLGNTNTDTGNDLTWHVGLGQQVYISKVTSIRLDYRLMSYVETQVNSQADLTGGPTVIGQRTNWSNTITLGIDFLIGGGSK